MRLLHGVIAIILLFSAASLFLKGRNFFPKASFIAIAGFLALSLSLFVLMGKIALLIALIGLAAFLVSSKKA